MATTQRFSGLLISDNKPWKELLERVLQPICRLETDADARNGLDRVRARADGKQYDVIVIDAHMSQDIPSLVHQIVSAQPGTKIVIASAAPHWRQVKQAFLAGASEYIEQSEDESSLARTFQELLRPAIPEEGKHR